MRIIGLDGFRNGWVAVWIDSDGSRDFELIEHISLITKHRPQLALIDIPIGLNDTFRACDLAAREMLGACRSRVFLGARRFLLQPELIVDYKKANSFAKSRYGKGVSKQLFALLPKIKQIDDVMTELHAPPLRETHPELVFFRLNFNRSLANKKTEQGRKQRYSILRREGFGALDNWCNRLTGTGAKIDDLFDACAAALAAINPARLSCVSEIDAKGLAMEMWY